MQSFSAEQFRQQFPAINSETIFLDSAATALKPITMIQASDDYYRHSGSSVYRGQSPEALRITQNYEQGRVRAAKLINAKSENDIIWTRGTTESINFIAQSYFRNQLKPNDEIIVSELEHHSNLLPWMILAQQTGAKIVKWPVNNEYCLDINTLKTLLNSQTKVVAVTQMSNVTGLQPNIAEMTQLAHNMGALVVIDGAQGIVHSPIDVTTADIDFYAFSAHKLYGPTGLGVCYGKPELLAKMSLWHGGGKMLTDVNFEEFTPAPIPHCFEAGTPNIAGVIAFSATLDWLANFNLASAENYSCALINYAHEQLEQISGYIRYSQANSSLLSFNFSNIHHSDLGLLLTEQKIALRYGQHCAQPLMGAIGTQGCLRISAMPYNNLLDMDKFINAVKFALSILNDK